MNGTATVVRKLDNLDQIALLCAFQVLSLPSLALGVTHSKAREVIRELTGRRAPRSTTPGQDLEGYLRDMGLEIVRESGEVRSGGPWPGP